jgi:hypothetical protein
VDNGRIIYGQAAPDPEAAGKVIVTYVFEVEGTKEQRAVNVAATALGDVFSVAVDAQETVNVDVGL